MRDFWSRRKAAVEAEARTTELQARRAEAEAQDAARAERSDEDLLAEAGLPDPELIDTPEMVRDFLRSALPQRLKTRALRKLWTMNPVLANLDGLVDYADDYTDAATCMPNVPTTYQVGKGLLAHVEAMAQQAEEARLRAEAGPEEEPPEVLSEADEAADAAWAQTLAQTDATREDAPAAAENDTDTPQDVPAQMVGARRMRFHFDQTT